MIGAYYNEIDPHAAQWLRNLITAGHIAPGDVDERDIKDVRPDDLRGYTQCHFFAGIGIWSRALRDAGWSDERPVWTGSCPCQPFSPAGRGDGFDDERHLWPHWHHLISQCRPDTIFGEQVAGKDGLGWLDLVQADMETADYACGAVDTCAAGFGAPHIRQRLYFAAYDLRPAASWMADRGRDRRGEWRNGDHLGNDGAEPHATIQARSMANAKCQQWDRGRSSKAGGKSGSVERVERLRDAGGLADTPLSGRDGGPGLCDQEPGCRRGEFADQGGAERLGNADGSRLLPGAQPGIHRGEKGAGARNGELERSGGIDGLADYHRTRSLTGRGATMAARHRDTVEPNGGFVGPMPTNGYWRDADWLLCRDGKWRPVEPGTFPLVNGATARVGRLRAYGNGLCLAQATGFVSAYMDRDTVDLSAAPAGDLFEYGASIGGEG